MPTTALRELRKALGLSIGELAALTNVSIGAISQWERGESTPSDSKVHKLADVLGVDPGDLQHEIQATRLAYVRRAVAKIKSGRIASSVAK